MARVLDGIRVLDFSRVFAGPAATQILGDLGADVVKLEEPGKGDEARYLGVDKQELEKYGGVSPSFIALNRNKRSIAVDLRCEAGRDVALAIAEKCDVIVHNFRPGAMARFGLGYDELRKRNPRVIYCEFTAYGQQGPMAHLGANDLALQAHSGLISLTGEPNRPPVRVGTAAVDLHGSLAIVCAVLAALFHRERTGEGQQVETSLLLSSAHLLNYFYTEYWMGGAVRGPMGTANHLSVPNQVFPAADGGVVIIAPTDEMWKRCADALAPAQLDRPEFRTQLDRLRNRDLLVECVSKVTRSIPAREIIARLSTAKVNVAKVNSIGEAADHDQLLDIGGVVELDVGGRRVKAVAPPFKMSVTPATVDRPPPKLAGDSISILLDFGLDRQRIAELKRRGAFGSGQNLCEELRAV